MKKQKTATAPGKVVSKPEKIKQEAAQQTRGKATRETIESIVVAVILAFLFRAFVAEAFVIPTGSMAPTLQGRHMDVRCVKCGYEYRTGASIENDGGGEVIKTTCPICRYTMALDKRRNPNQRSFNGDRILVSKFAYELGIPKRWDVIVFKYPGNAKQNYIKRLVGIPNETLRIVHGDVYYRKNTEADQPFRIARKPPEKLKAMLQLVDDTDYRAREMIAVGWPPRWQDWQSPQDPSWRQRAGGRGFETTGVSERVAWLRYRHVIPRRGRKNSVFAAAWDEEWDEWNDIEQGRMPPRLAGGDVRGQLITDYYAYNDGVQRPPTDRIKALGLHWVGDLAVECDVEIQGEHGRLLLDLVEGGVHYTCTIDVATGEATLSIDDGRGVFEDARGARSRYPKASTRLRGPGEYHVRWSNCDDEVLLWIDDRVVEFDGPTTYRSPANVKPVWSPEDPGDLEPAGVGALGVPVAVSRLRLWRDVYYVATSYQTPMADNDYKKRYSESEIVEILRTPELWSKTDLFESRRDDGDVEFTLGDGEFFPLGDNSPQSRDARLWSVPDYSAMYSEPPEPFVRRELLTGKALLIYWPHSWRRPIPYLPNFKRMRLIR